MKQPLNFAIVDDHTLFLKGLEELISQGFKNSNVNCFGSILEFQSHRSTLSELDLLICDIELPGEDVFTFFNGLRRSFPNLPVLVISMHKKLSIIKKCKELQIDGYLLKDDDDYLSEAINAILKGQHFYSPRIVEFYSKYSNQLNNISAREEEIILLMVKGFSNLEISDYLSVGLETVKTHKRNIRTKLGMHDLSDIISYAKQNFLIK
ncbi:response regulator transcription factor [Marivirga salinae]|uniref:Response regulator transcription factor n=1 Tax=Marivirga salinarum TaxID=3059078 RepID=A0AA51NAH8_9BACT|nr:response regulator transcription factor [Marivirga sp. BDSF4-3]WMN11704.1 response regulator transcription factor [Marivirga sp. BDSF4-3]